MFVLICLNPATFCHLANMSITVKSMCWKL